MRRAIPHPVYPAALVLGLLVALTSPLGTDYASDAGPAMRALLQGDLQGALALQPQMGQLSLLLRWPVAQLAQGLGADQLWIYRAGAAACMIFPALLAAHLATRAARARRASGSMATVLLICATVLVVNPVTLRAMELGHPEEVLCAAFCVAALLAALNGRWTWSGVLLGLALATKQWALLAIAPVLLAAPGKHGRFRIAVPALAIGAIGALAPLAADPGAFISSLQRPATGLHEIRPGNLWSLLFGTSQMVHLGDGEIAPVTFVPGWLRLVAHPLILVLAALLPALWLRRRAIAAAPADALLLLALVMLLRCALDPWNHEYYHLPFLLALAAYEIVALRRSPVLTGISSVVLWIVFDVLTNGSGQSTTADVLYVAWATLATAVLALMLWLPRMPALRPRRASSLIPAA